MHALDKVLDDYGLNRYKLSVKTGITESTLSSIVNRNTAVSDIKLKIFEAIAETSEQNLTDIIDEMKYYEKENKMNKLEKIFNAHGFTNVDGNLDELQEKGKTKISMQFEETPALMDAINKETEYTAYVDDSTDYIVIEK